MSNDTFSINSGSALAPLETEPAKGETSPIIQYLFYVYYAIVFLSGFFGNIIIMLSVYKYERMRTVVNICLVNLALADFMFVVLSVFDGLTFLFGQWKFGDAMCRIQSTLIEISYTVSVCTLTAIAFERYISICYPHRIKRTLSQALKACGLIWLFGLVFCSALFKGYSVRPDEKKVIQCINDNWSNESRLSFYVFHSLIVYMLPLSIMCISHTKISKALLEQRRRTISAFSPSRDKLTDANVSTIDVSSSINDINGTYEKKRKPFTVRMSVKSQQHNLNTEKVEREKHRAKTINRRMKIIKLLVVVTAIFFILWTPFIAVRLLKYLNVKVSELLWRGTQLLIFGTTGVNVFIYALMSPAFRTAFKSILICHKTLDKYVVGSSNSRSFDLSETLKKQTTLNRSTKNINM